MALSGMVKTIDEARAPAVNVTAVLFCFVAILRGVPAALNPNFHYTFIGTFYFGAILRLRVPQSAANGAAGS